MYLYLYLCLYLYLYLYQLVPYLIYRFLIYLHVPTYCMQEPPQQGIIYSSIHPSTPSLPPSRLPAWYMSVSVPVRLYVRVSPCICPCACTYIQYPQKVHIKGTYQRYISKIHVHVCLGVCGCFLFKKYICRSDRHKKPPDERPCTRPVFHNFTR